MCTRKRLPLLVVLAALLTVPARAQIAYVRAGGTGGGTTWADAVGDVQQAIDALQGGPGEVWVAEGLYVSPATGFRLPAGIDLYGGFPDDATTEGLEDRDPQAHVTVLSGDTDGNDALDPQSELPIPASMLGNAPHVIDVVNFVSDDTVIDGFTISGGNGDLDQGDSSDDKSGGGIRAVGTQGRRSTARLVLRACEIRANRAGSSDPGGGYRTGSSAVGADGGGVYVAGLNLLAEHTTFSNNAAGDGSDGAAGTAGDWGMDGGIGGNGGGLAVMGANDVTLTHVHFEQNGAGKGGHGGKGGDTVGGKGGSGGWGAAGGNGGGLYLDSVVQVLIQNSTCLDNQAGIAGNGGDGGSTVDGNATGGGGGMGGGSKVDFGMPSGCGGGAALRMCISVLIENSAFMKNTSGEGGTGGKNGTGPSRTGDGLPGDDGEGGEGGGLLLLDSDSTMENATFADNKAAGNGGGLAFVISFMGSLHARHITLAENTTDGRGGALSFSSNYGDQPANTVRFVNSVFWGNASRGGAPVRAADSDVWATCAGMAVANSILADAPGTVDVVDCVATDPLLKDPSWNGGDTPTLAPDPNSPVIDATFLDPSGFPATDQRGFPRDDGAPDAGAFELRGQASGVTMTATAGNTATASWTPGVWGHSVVFVRPDDPGDPKPEPWDYRMYNPDSQFGSGGFITNTAWSCVYAGTGTAVAITGLTAGTKYTIMVCDTLTPDYVHNTEDATDNPLVFETSNALAKATLVSPVHCPDEGAAGPDGDDPIYGHSLIPEPAFVWNPPANSDGADVQVWLDGTKIGDTAINPIGFRCFDGTTWTDFPDTGGMPSGTQRLAFLRGESGEKTEVTAQRAGPTSERQWWVVTAAKPQRGASESDHWRFLVRSVTWEDGRPVAGITLVGKAQMDQLREETNALQRLRGLPETAFVDPTIAKNKTPILAVHFQELRDAIGQAADVIGEDTASWAWTDPVLIPNQTVIRAAHLQELHDALEGLYPGNGAWAGDRVTLVRTGAVYDTIQGAVGQAISGDTIVVAAGTYAGDVTIGVEGLTINGANVGVHPAVGTNRDEPVGARGDETVITGTIHPLAKNITLDGLKFVHNTARNITAHAGTTDVDGFTIQNCIFDWTVGDWPGYTTGHLELYGHYTNFMFQFNRLVVDSDSAALFLKGDGDGGDYDGLTCQYNYISSYYEAILWGAGRSLDDGVVKGNEISGDLGLGLTDLGACIFNIGHAGNLEFSDNEIHHVWFTVAQLGIDGGKIVNNTWRDMAPYDEDPDPGEDPYLGSACIQLWGGQWDTTVSTDVEITGNTFIYNTDVNDSGRPMTGIRLLPKKDGTTAAIDPTTIHIHWNYFINLGRNPNSLAVRNEADTNKAVDATHNWWDTTIEDEIAHVILAPADVTPYLLSPRANLFVDDSWAGKATGTALPATQTIPDSAGTDPAHTEARTAVMGTTGFGTLEAALANALPGETIYVAAGTQSPVSTVWALDQSLTLRLVWSAGGSRSDCGYSAHHLD